MLIVPSVVPNAPRSKTKLKTMMAATVRNDVGGAVDTATTPRLRNNTKANKVLNEEDTEEGLTLHPQLLVGVAAMLIEIQIIRTPWLRTRRNLLIVADTGATITIEPNCTVEENVNANVIDEDRH